MTVLDYKWINTNGGCIGVVIAENDYGQQAYICVVPGADENADVQYVKNWGSKLSLEVAQAHFPKLVNTDKYGN